jgi:hypothetical protein
LQKADRQRFAMGAAHMTYAPTTDPQFLRTLESWITEKGEILTLFRYANSAGSKDFEFCYSFEELQTKIASLPSLCCIIAFRERQLPIRGVVDAQFIDACKRAILDGEEFLILDQRETRQQYPHCSYAYFSHRAGESHAELQEELEDWIGRLVAVGQYPDWLYDSDIVLSAVVPDANGATSGGVY